MADVLRSRSPSRSFTNKWAAIQVEEVPENCKVVMNANTAAGGLPGISPCSDLPSRRQERGGTTEKNKVIIARSFQMVTS